MKKLSNTQAAVAGSALAAAAVLFLVATLKVAKR